MKFIDDAKKKIQNKIDNVKTGFNNKVDSVKNIFKKKPAEAPVSAPVHKPIPNCPIEYNGLFIRYLYINDITPVGDDLVADEVTFEDKNVICNGSVVATADFSDMLLDMLINYTYLAWIVSTTSIRVVFYKDPDKSKVKKLTVTGIKYFDEYWDTVPVGTPVLLSEDYENDDDDKQIFVVRADGLEVGRVRDDDLTVSASQLYSGRKIDDKHIEVYV